MQCGRLLAVEPRQHANAAQLRPPGHERIVVPHERSARLLALEVRRVNGPDLAVVALEVAEALAGRRQQERVGAPLGRGRIGGACRNACGRSHVSVRVDRRNGEPVTRARREVAVPRPPPPHLAHQNPVAIDPVPRDLPAAAGASGPRQPHLRVRDPPLQPAGAARWAVAADDLHDTALCAGPAAGVGCRHPVGVQARGPHAHRKAAHALVEPAVAVHPVAGHLRSVRAAARPHETNVPRSGVLDGQARGWRQGSPRAGRQRRGSPRKSRPATGCRIAAPPASWCSSSTD